MIVKQFAAAALVLCLSVMLGSCSPFSGFVADRWPHWAGGMPDDIPPRPGAPGYNEFIAHGQPSQDAQSATGAEKPAVTEEKSAGTDQKPTAAGEKPAAMDEKTGAQAAPSGDRPPSDSNAVQGGLY
ncbi:MAG: hypothetical protein ABSC37_13650 [Xanthobacteraceae bacterium]|jgi:hypothetical protein